VANPSTHGPLITSKKETLLPPEPPAACTDITARFVVECRRSTLAKKLDVILALRAFFAMVESTFLREINLDGV
jgi:hypothetical protein